MLPPMGWDLGVGGQAFGVGIGVEGGEKGLQMCRDHSLEHRMARIAWFVGGNSRRHECTLRIGRLNRTLIVDRFLDSGCQRPLSPA